MDNSSMPNWNPLQLESGARARARTPPRPAAAPKTAPEWGSCAKCGYALQLHIMGSGPNLVRSMALALVVLFFERFPQNHAYYSSLQTCGTHWQVEGPLALMCGQFWKRFPNGMRKCFHHIALICTECLTCRLICSHMQQVSEAFCCAMDTKSMPPQVCEDVSSVLEKKPPSFCCYCLLRLFLCSDWRPGAAHPSCFSQSCHSQTCLRTDRSTS